jgi:Domain of unknown function (DUF5664)
MPTPRLPLETNEPKLRFDLIPPNPLTEVARAFTVGAVKHGEDEYLKHPKPITHHVGALLRHLYAYLRGEERDPDGQLHLASVAARALMIMELSRRASSRV